MTENLASRSGDPLEIVDDTARPYEERLRLLQEWKADLARDGAPIERLEELDGAIQALETGARVQGDGPKVPGGYENKQSR